MSNDPKQANRRSGQLLSHNEVTDRLARPGISPPSGPGLGIGIDQEFVARYEIG